VQAIGTKNGEGEPKQNARNESSDFQRRFSILERAKCNTLNGSGTRKPASITIAPDTIQSIACAGSGKTEIVARRVAALLKDGATSGLAPRNIVAFTFTDKAAAELKERIITRCREELGEVHGTAEMFVGTIHAFCLQLLKTEAPKCLKFDVLNEVQQSLFIDRHSPPLIFGYGVQINPPR